jgi:hypothetical protein
MFSYNEYARTTLNALIVYLSGLNEDFSFRYKFHRIPALHLVIYNRKLYSMTIESIHYFGYEEMNKETVVFITRDKCDDAYFLNYME